MTLDEIDNEWNGDAKISRSDLIGEASSIPKLHSKYYNIFIAEKKLMIKEKGKLKKLEFLLWQFYSKQLTKEELDKYELEFPDKTILKSDVSKWIDDHEDIVALRLKVTIQEEKVDFLKSILSMIGNRTFQIKNMIDMTKFEAGL